MDDDWESDFEDDFEGDADFDDEWETETRECPHCGADVYEDAVACPVCGEYITSSTHPFTDRPRWWVLLGTLGVIATILCLTLFS